jgi:ribosomal protein L11 methyltransferase
MADLDTAHPHHGDATHRYTLACHPGDREVLAAQLWQAGALGVWEQPESLAAWFADPQAEVPAGGSWTQEPDVDYQASWKASIEPVLAGPVAIVPTWLADEFVIPEGIETVVVLDPGQAFGSGHHATTTLCTEYLAEQDLVGRSLFDVGTGSGVLAIVGALRGAAPVLAVDIDAHAVTVTLENTELAGLSFPTHEGSADFTEDTFEVVVANLVTDVVTALAQDLAARVAPGGVLITSGIDALRAHLPREALALTGLVLMTSRVRDGWAGDLWSRPRD